MRFDVGGVDHLRFRRSTIAGELPEQVFPYAAPSPPSEAIVDRRVRPVFRWTIAPPRTRLQHMNDAADDAPIVVPIRSGQSRRQVRFYPRPLLIIQPKQAATRTRESHGAN